MKQIIMDIETTGLYPWEEDRITMIGLKEIGEEPLIITNESEYELLREFEEWILDNNFEVEFITFNGRQFDMPFIFARASKLCIDFSYFILCKYINTDIMDKLPKRISLRNLAIELNVTQKSLSGLDAIKFWELKDLESLKSYLCNDLQVTEEVWLKLNGGLKNENS